MYYVAYRENTFSTLTHLAFSFLLGWRGRLREETVAAISAEAATSSSSSPSELFSSSVAMLPGDPETLRETCRCAI